VTTRYELTVERPGDGGVNLALYELDGRRERGLYILVVYPPTRARGRLVRDLTLVDLVARAELFGVLDEATGDVTWADPDAIDARGAAVDQFLEWYAQRLPAGDYAVRI
jgi:hypothetical protein